MRRIARAVGAVSGLILVSLLATSPAAGEEKSTKPRIAVIEFKNFPRQTAPAPLDVIGFAWGDADAAGPMKPVFVKSWSTSGDAVPPHRGGGSNQMSMDDTAGKEKSPSSFGEWIADVERPAAASSPYRANDRLRTAGPKNGNAAPGDPDRPVIAGSVPNPPASPGANETITVGGGRTETASGQATGKRQHMPIRVRPYYDQPRGEGSVWIRVSTPWAACRVGARYPSLSLSGGAKTYELEDVTVAGCGAGEEVAFNYKKVTVRGWDPKKKEE